MPKACLGFRAELQGFGFGLRAACMQRTQGLWPLGFVLGLRHAILRALGV